MTEVTENVTEVTKNITEVTKDGFGTKSMAMYDRVSQYIAAYCSMLQYIAVYCNILQYFAVYRCISQYIVVHRSISHFLAVIDPNSFGLVSDKLLRKFKFLAKFRNLYKVTCFHPPEPENGFKTICSHSNFKYFFCWNALTAG